MARITPNCTALIQTGARPQPDADIAGIGVFLAFVLSAYITIGTVILAYTCGFVEDGLLSAVDRRVFFVKPYADTYPRIHEAVRRAVLALGDQQIVTGIAIMGSGFDGLRRGRISVYHFQIVLYLAWMSSSVHLSALTLLGSFLNSHKGLLAWRLNGMLVLLVLLLIGLVPTFSNFWGIDDLGYRGLSGWGIPAICFWGRLWGEGTNPDSLLSFIILIVSYVWKIGALMGSARSRYRLWLRHPIENVLLMVLKLPAQRYTRNKDWISLWTFRLLLCVVLPVLVLFEFASSFAASLWLSVLGLIFGTLEVQVPREQNQYFTSSQESSWNFGQLVPLILLIQPFGTVSEFLWLPKESERSEDPYPAPGVPQSPLEAFPNQDKELRSLIEFLAGVEHFSLNSSERLELQSIILGSHVVKLYLYLLQLALIGCATLTFLVDRNTIGIESTQNWNAIVNVVPFAAVATVGFDLVFIPFSRLGRLTTRDQTIDTSLRNDEERRSLP